MIGNFSIYFDCFVFGFFMIKYFFKFLYLLKYVCRFFEIYSEKLDCYGIVNLIIVDCFKCDLFQFIYFCRKILFDCLFQKNVEFSDIIGVFCICSI